ncbi:MAG: hypothetical protein Q9193_003067 [Seirophora villosa]
MASQTAPQASSLPMPPFVDIPGMMNVRDVGGYPTTELRDQPRSSIRRGLLYRGGEPSRITPEGRRAFKDLGIQKVFDVRTEDEIGPESEDMQGIFRRPIVDLDDTERISINVYSQNNTKDYDLLLNKREWEKMGKNTTEIYLVLRFIAKAVDVLDNGVRLKPLFIHLAQPDPAPIYLHCTGGKDRTGTVIMVLYRLAGVAPEMIADEYALTNLALQQQAPQLVEMVLKIPGLGLTEESVKQLGVARKEYILGLCDVLERRYGGAERYFREYLKMTPTEVQAIKSALVVNERPIFTKEAKGKAFGIGISSLTDD